jgi:surface polysaccharide O-acyltransferase-like enzyme
MFLIVLFHVIYHGHVVDNCQNGGVKIIIEIILFATLVHVNSFIIITGYFQIDSKFTQKKVWKLLNASWFYRIVIMVILL